MYILNAEDLIRAWVGGNARRADSRQRQSDDKLKRNLTEEEYVELDVNARGAEIVIERLTGLPIGRVCGDFKKPDIGDCIQVRHTTRPNGMLIFRETPFHKDNPDHYYVLVTGYRPIYFVCGFASGHTIKGMGKYDTSDGKPSWRLPKHLLKDIFECPALINYKPSWAQSAATII